MLCTNSLHLCSLGSGDGSIVGRFSVTPEAPGDTGDTGDAGLRLGNTDDTGLGPSETDDTGIRPGDTGDTDMRPDDTDDTGLKPPATLTTQSRGLACRHAPVSCSLRRYAMVAPPCRPSPVDTQSCHRAVTWPVTSSESGHRDVGRQPSRS